MSAAAQPTDKRITDLCLQRVLRDFGALLTVTALDDGSFRIATPFALTNGDMFPFFVESCGAGWRMTDRGATLASLRRGHVELARGDLDVIERVTCATGFTLSDSHHISGDFNDLPSPLDLAKGIQLEACISALIPTSAQMRSTITGQRRSG
jgi:Domain of unknown function DUF1828